MIKLRKRILAYVLDQKASGGLKELSPEIEKLTKEFVEKAKKSARSMADPNEEPEDYRDFLMDAVSNGPRYPEISSSDLVELLIGNPVLGAIPLKDLKAEELIRGDDIDVYDYLQAALEAIVEQAALMWLKEAVKPQTQRDSTETVLRNRQQRPSTDADEKGTKIERPQKRGSVRGALTLQEAYDPVYVYTVFSQDSDDEPEYLIFGHTTGEAVRAAQALVDIFHQEGKTGYAHSLVDRYNNAHQTCQKLGIPEHECNAIYRRLDATGYDVYAI